MNLFGDVVNRIIDNGIVIQIDKKGGTFNKVSPVCSCRIRLTGEQTVNKEDIRYYPSFFPPNFVVLPEEGEEVFVIFTQPNRTGQGYWISKKTSSESYQEFGDAFKTNSKLEVQWGGQKPKFDKRDSVNVKNDNTREYQSGDIGLYGVGGNGILFSYDKKTGNVFTDISNGISQGRTDSVQNIDKSSARLLLGNDVNFDKIFGIPNVLDKTVQGTETLIVSNNTHIYNPSAGVLNSTVLGNEQQKWLEKYIELNQKFLKIVMDTLDVLKTHHHTTSQGPTISVVEAPNFISYNSDLDTIYSDITAHAKIINKHHSKSVLIN